MRISATVFEEMEYEGVKELYKTGFVLIAGGFEERLSYSGIKLDLPVCTIETDYSTGPITWESRDLLL